MVKIVQCFFREEGQFWRKLIFRKEISPIVNPLGRKHSWEIVNCQLLLCKGGDSLEETRKHNARPESETESVLHVNNQVGTCSDIPACIHVILQFAANYKAIPEMMGDTYFVVNPFTTYGCRCSNVVIKGASRDHV